MQHIQVIVNKLNKRKSPVLDFNDKRNIVNVVYKDQIIAVDGEITNVLGKWFKDTNGYYYSEIGCRLITEEAKISQPVSFLQKPLKESQAWFSKLLKIPELWKTYEAFGKDVITAVLDTGYDTNNTDISSNVLKAEKLIDYGSHEEDIFGHGTRCTALVCCTNAGQQLIGIAPQSKVIAAKISNKGEIIDFDVIIRGIRWAIDNGADIVSLSYGSDLNDEITIKHFYDEIDTLLRDQQVLVFACCGNNYNANPSKGVRYPAAFSGKNDQINMPPIEKIIAVGATNNDNELDIITLLNDFTTLHAPGRDIISYQLNNVADAASGTSMSTPIVAGIAALAVSYLKKKNGAWDALALKKVIYDTADPIKDDPIRKIINPVNLLKMLQ